MDGRSRGKVKSSGDPVRRPGESRHHPYGDSRPYRHGEQGERPRSRDDSYNRSSGGREYSDYGRHGGGSSRDYGGPPRGYGGGGGGRGYNGSRDRGGGGGRGGRDFGGSGGYASRSYDRGYGATSAPPGPPRESKFRASERDGQELCTSMPTREDETGNGEPPGRGGARRRNAGIVMTRPASVNTKIGEYGDPIKLCANFFQLRKRTGWSVFHYKVDFDPDESEVRTRKALLNVHKDVFGQGFIFDGNSLFTSQRLPELTELVSERRSDQAEVKLTIRFIKEVDPLDDRMLQIFGVLIKKCMNHLGMMLIGKSSSYFDTNTAVNIAEHRLQIFSGYSTGIRQYENDVLMLAETSHKIVRGDTVLDNLYRIMDQHPQDFEQAAANELLGAVVMTMYNHRTYRIDDIDWQANPTMTFKKKDEQISLKDYYQTAYNVTVTDLRQPLLVSKPSKKDRRGGRNTLCFLVPQFCCMTGLTENMRSDFRLMKDVANVTRMDPMRRTNALNQFMNRLVSNDLVIKDFEDWGLSFARNLVTINGRMLPTEKIYQHEDIYTYNRGNADWSRNIRDHRLDRPMNLTNWVLIYPSRQERDAENFYRNLCNVTGRLGMRVNDPQRVPLPDDRSTTFMSALQRNICSSTELVVCIVSNNKKDRYDAIKKICCVDCPVPSQVLVGKTLMKNAMSVCTKVALQINTKLGGELYHLNIPLTDTMFIGYDTYKDSSQRGRSVCGLVASLNGALTRYYSTCTFQRPGEELSSQMGPSIIKALRKYKEVNNKFPAKIIIYRDGVSEGQIQYVKDHEIAAVRAVFAEADISPKLVFIVVTKKVSTRLFSAEPMGNPPSGTVCDDVVTHPEWYDFFLVSQSVRQGTVSPTHYNIIEDQLGLSPGKYQRLTYKLTHLYYNWPGTVRVPAPCQYARKLAALVGQSFHTAPGEELADKLFYL